MTMPGDAPPSGPDEAPVAQWRAADVKRAITAAEKAGLRHYRVEIAPDGTISIVVGPSDTAPGSASEAEPRGS